MSETDDERNIDDGSQGNPLPAKSYCSPITHNYWSIIIILFERGIIRLLIFAFGSIDIKGRKEETGTSTLPLQRGSPLLYVVGYLFGITELDPRWQILGFIDFLIL